MFYKIDNPSLYLHYKILLSYERMNFHFNTDEKYGIVGFNTVSPMSASFVVGLAEGSDRLLPPYCGKIIVEVSRRLVNGSARSFLLIGMFLIDIDNKDADRLLKEDLDIVISAYDKKIELVPAQ